MGRRLVSVEDFALRLVMRGHLVFIAFAIVMVASTIETVSGTELGAGWRTIFMPVTIAQTATQFLAYAWFAVLIRATLLALAPDARARWRDTETRGEAAVADWMERNTVVFFYYLLFVGLFGFLGAMVNLWSLREAAPFQTLSRAVVSGSYEVFYAVTLGFLAWTLSVVRARTEAA